MQLKGVRGLRLLVGVLWAFLCSWCLVPLSHAGLWADTDCDGDADGKDLWAVAACCSQGECPGVDDLCRFASAFGKCTGTEDAVLGVGADEQAGGGGLVGRWVRLTTGNALEVREDVRFPSPWGRGFVLGAVYNSRSSQKGASGWGWTHTYEVRLEKGLSLIPTLRVVDETGRAHYFREGETPGVYEGVSGTRGRVIEEGDGYTWHRPGGKRYGFTEAGVLEEVYDGATNRLRLTYDPEGRLGEVRDEATGRAMTLHYNTGGLLEHVEGPVTDAVPAGVWVSYAYDARENLVTVTYADGSGVDYAYQDPEDAHNLTSKRDREGRLLGSWGYDAADRCTQHSSPEFGTLTLAYPSEPLVEVTDGYGTLRKYEIGTVGGRRRLLGVTGPGPAPYTVFQAVGWSYDERARLTEVTYPTGLMNRYGDFDEKGRPRTLTLGAQSPGERVLHLTYHPELDLPLRVREQSVLGEGDRETVWDYDEDGNAIPNESPTERAHRVVETGYTMNAEGAVVPYTYTTTYSWNAKGQILSVDGPLEGAGDTTTFAYDPQSADLWSITRPVVGSRTFGEYDAAGHPGRITDENGHAEVLTYEGRGRVKSVHYEADGSTKTFTYDRGGLLTRSTDEDGVTTVLSYDPETGKLIRKTDAQGNTVTYTYDALGNLTEKSFFDPQGQRRKWQRRSYDHPGCPGLLWKEIFPDETFTAYGYDSAGNLTFVTTPGGETTTYGYDLFGRLTSVTRPGGLETHYGYDAHGNLDTVINPATHETTFLYDDRGRAVQTTSPDTGTVRAAYDALGNVVYRVDAKGEAVLYTHDALGRLTRVDFPQDPDVTFTYDAGQNGRGRLTGMADGSGTTQLLYDERGRQIQKTVRINGQAFTLTRTLSPGGRVLSLTYPTGRGVSYERRDCLCRVSGVTTTYAGQSQVLWQGVRYRPFGGAGSLGTGNGGTVQNVYDQWGRLIISNPQSAHERTYSYDANGHLSQIQAQGAVWQDRAYGYDALGRLETAQGWFGQIRYAYDAVGNRQSRTLNGRVETYGYEEGTSRLKRVESPTEGEILYAYDANGNPVTLGNKTLTYDDQNRLIRVEAGGDIVAQYTYNGWSRRVKKEVQGTQTIFLYDFEGRLVGEADGQGAVHREYVHRGGNVIAQVESETGRVLFYLNDALGTPQMLVDETNRVVWEGEYEPFGRARVNIHATATNHLRFPGQYYDEETGLHYNYHRYYDPRTGRYLTPDPIGLVGGINVFAYVQNNPINLIDPFGLWGINYGGSLMGIDFSATLYDSNKGWFPSTTTDIGVSTTAFGGGIQITFDTPVESKTNPCEDVNVSMGMGKYLGVTYNTELSRGSVNLGLGLGLPITFSTPVQNFAEGLSNSLQRAFK